MHNEEFFVQSLVYLLSAVLSVPLAKKLGLGSVLGQLIAGVIIGPFVLGVVGDQKDVLEFSEMGVVMMLFLVGLELKPHRLWKLKKSILGLGGVQVISTIFVTVGLCLLFGYSIESAVAIGCIFSLSSTAIALQTLTEKELLKSKIGEKSFSILLFQDLAIIPMLSIFPLLAIGEAPIGTLELEQWPALKITGIILGIILGGRYLSRPAFRIIAGTKLRELFTAFALLIVVGIAWVMGKVGLSPALGTFMAGVILADSEYRHELESVIGPFKGLLLGLFFISVGASIDFKTVASHPVQVLLIILGLIVIKWTIIFLLARLFKLKKSEAFYTSIVLAQGGEFAFVLLAFSQRNNILPSDLNSTLTASVALSMLATPLLMILFEKFLLKKFDEPLPNPPDEEEIPPGKVIVAGFGRFGQIVARLLHANKVPTVLLDHNPQQIDMVRRFGLKCFYGDVSRMDLLETAGIANISLFVLAIDDKEKALEVAEKVKKHYPHIKILARAHDRRHAFELLTKGVDTVHRETFSSALDMGISALRMLGMRAYQSYRLAKSFKKHDEQSIHELFQHWGDDKKYLKEAQRRAESIQALIEEDEADKEMIEDHAWDQVPH